MVKPLLTIPAIALITLIAQPMMLHGQATSPNFWQGNSMLSELKVAVLREIGAPEKNVQITKAGPVLKIFRISMRTSETTAMGRENEAEAIAKVISSAILKKKNHAGIVIIRLEYVLRPKTGPDKVIDIIEYRENAKGIFQHHKT